MTTIKRKPSRTKAIRFNVRHIPWIEVYKHGEAFLADVFDPAWGKVYTTKPVGTAIVATALAKHACRECCGDVVPNVFSR